MLANPPDLAPEPCVGSIGVHSGMPDHQILETCQFIRRLQNFDFAIVGFNSGESPGCGQNQFRSWNAPGSCRTAPPYRPGRSAAGLDLKVAGINGSNGQWEPGGFLLPTETLSISLSIGQVTGHVCRPHTPSALPPRMASRKLADPHLS
jgi:hypothetical protein